MRVGPFGVRCAAGMGGYPTVGVELARAPDGSAECLPRIRSMLYAAAEDSTAALTGRSRVVRSLRGARPEARTCSSVEVRGNGDSQAEGSRAVIPQAASPSAPRAPLRRPLPPRLALALERHALQPLPEPRLLPPRPDREAREPLDRADVPGVDLERRGVGGERLVLLARPVERDREVEPWIGGGRASAFGPTRTRGRPRRACPRPGTRRRGCCGRGRRRGRPRAPRARAARRVRGPSGSGPRPASRAARRAACRAAGPRGWGSRGLRRRAARRGECQEPEQRRPHRMILGSRRGQGSSIPASAISRPLR